MGRRRLNPMKDPEVVKRAQATKRANGANAAQSQRMKQLWQDPTYRAKQQQSGADRWGDPEYRAACQVKPERTKKQWTNPEFKAKQDSAWIDERRNLISEQSKARWRDPAYRAKMSKIMSDRAKARWRDPSDRFNAITPESWTEPERIVKGLLDDIGADFDDHVWIRTKDFTFNADFANKATEQIIHVDGVFWHSKPENQTRDRRIDEWCEANGWRSIRITDEELADLGTAKQRLMDFC